MIFFEFFYVLLKKHIQKNDVYEGYENQLLNFIFLTNEF